jgi:chorismate mutase
MAEDLKRLREEIDRIDDELLAALARRWRRRSAL